MLALKSQVFVQWAYRTFLEEAGGQPDAFRVCRQSLLSGASESQVLRARPWRIGFVLEVQNSLAMVNLRRR
jgi:hypothetical protein